MEQLWSFDALHLFSVFWGFMDGPFLRRRVFFLLSTICETDGYSMLISTILQA